MSVFQTQPIINEQPQLSDEKKQEQRQAREQLRTPRTVSSKRLDAVVNLTRGIEQVRFASDEELIEALHEYLFAREYEREYQRLVQRDEQFLVGVVRDLYATGMLIANEDGSSYLRQCPHCPALVNPYHGPLTFSCMTREYNFGSGWEIRFSHCKNADRIVRAQKMQHLYELYEDKRAAAALECDATPETRPGGVFCHGCTSCRGDFDSWAVEFLIERVTMEDLY